MGISFFGKYLLNNLKNNYEKKILKKIIPERQNLS